MKRRKSERGATLVEAALTLLLFFWLILGIWNFGRVYHVYQIATNAAREGARFSAAPDPATGTLPSVTDVQNRVQFYLTLGSVPVSTDNISVTQTTTATVNSVPITFTTVHVTAPFEFHGLPFGPINVNTEARMRNETN
ncbi:MAG TPA: TadE/TadG family type IV pilus assembly protein [Clostridia bacterium]|nr:TadE/TadG family type IV pilus assembly protein [Clostridia bacterium]